MSAIRESEMLHGRVRAFANDTCAGALPKETFESIAFDIFAFQTAHIPGIRRLADARGAPALDVDHIPAVPVEAFRLSRVAAHPGELDQVRFRTSGTTGGAAGVHPMRTTETYRELSIVWGRAALASAWSGPRVVVALASEPGSDPTSSLGFMMRAFMEAFDGRSLFGVATSMFDPGEPGRFLLQSGRVDIELLRRVAGRALERDEPLLILATGFSLMLLLDELGGAHVEAPRRTVVMPTGGFKGRTREMKSDELVRAVAGAFRIPEGQIVGEYGMTELSSQLYEGVLPGGALRAERGVFLPPPWLRVAPVRPDTLEPISDGEVGLARFVDLGNVDFPLAIVTQDLVRSRGAGIELIGRRKGAPPRGCSLAVEQMVLEAEPS